MSDNNQPICRVMMIVNQSDNFYFIAMSIRSNSNRDIGICRSSPIVVLVEITTYWFAGTFVLDRTHCSAYDY